jgi:hypothetical protein
MVGLLVGCPVSWRSPAAVLKLLGRIQELDDPVRSLPGYGPPRVIRRFGVTYTPGNSLPVADSCLIV